MIDMSQAELIHGLQASGDLKIIQRDDVFRFSLDSVILADFVKINPRTRNIMDFGTGLAPIPLLLSLKTKALITGIEIQDDLCELAKKSVVLNHLEEQISINKDDIRVVHSHYMMSSFDIVTCNPPFFKNKDEKITSENIAVRNAKHELLIDFQTIVIQAKRLLKTGGLFVFVHRADRLEDLIIFLHNEGFALKRMRFVYPKPGVPAVMVLIEAANTGKAGNMKLLEPLYILDEFGKHTVEAMKIFGDNQEAGNV